MSVDLLLVNPLFLQRDPVERRLMTPYFPLGLLYLAAVAREAGYSVALFDGMFESDPTAFSRALDTHSPRVVGLSILTTVRDTAFALADMARARGIPVVVGGPDPTARPEYYLDPRPLAAGDTAPPAADVVVLGEGEETLLELLPVMLSGMAAWRLASIRGLAYRGPDGSTRCTPPRPLCSSLDALPFPARDLIDMDAYQRAWRSAHGYSSLSVIITRGCPYACAWCQKSVFGKSFRSRSPDSVAAEMALIKEQYAPDQVRVVDDVMGIDRRWLAAWRDALVMRDAVLPFECLSRVDLVDREMLSWLKTCGCFRVSFGAESGSQRVLDAMAKGTTVDQIRRTADLCHALDIEVYFYIMLGYPAETWVDIEATAKLLVETLPDTFSSTIAYPLPGTPFYEQVADQLSDCHDWQHTAENRTLYVGEYSTRFYRWAQQWLHKEWQMARLRAGLDHRSTVGRLRLWAALQATRVIVRALRSLPPDACSVPLIASER